MQSSIKSFNPRARAGRDHGVQQVILLQRCFNPRARAGRDLYFCVKPIIINVSIHAPARGATIGFQHCLHHWMFQSTRPRGARPNFYHMAFALLLFQSTRPRGARRLGCLVGIQIMKFQSTRPRGARPASSSAVFCNLSFQSTRPRGARLSTHTENVHILCFNPRARAGRDSVNAAETM